MCSLKNINPNKDENNGAVLETTLTIVRSKYLIEYYIKNITPALMIILLTNSGTFFLLTQSQRSALVYTFIMSKKNRN